MNKTVSITFILILFTCVGLAQVDIKRTRHLNNRLFFGGGLGLQLGSYIGIDISPTIGYRPIANTNVGIKATYQYYGGSNISWHQNVFGGSLFSQYIAFDKIIGHAEYELLHINTDWQNNLYENTNQWFYTPLLGLGLYQQTGNKGAVLLLVLFDVSGSDISPYTNPIFRISFIF